MVMVNQSITQVVSAIAAQVSVVLLPWSFPSCFTNLAEFMRFWISMTISISLQLRSKPISEKI
jgi:hypothetical protein